MNAQNNNLTDRLVETIAQRCFGGVLPHCPEAIALAVVATCLPDENAESLTLFVNSLIPVIEVKLAEQSARRVRLGELAEEIAILRGRIARSSHDEKLVKRIFADTPERAAELFELADGRARCEAALQNLLKERDELNSGK